MGCSGGGSVQIQQRCVKGGGVKCSCRGTPSGEKGVAVVRSLENRHLEKKMWWILFRNQLTKLKGVANILSICEISGFPSELKNF